MTAWYFQIGPNEKCNYLMIVKRKLIDFFVALVYLQAGSSLANDGWGAVHARRYLSALRGFCSEFSLVLDAI